MVCTRMNLMGLVAGAAFAAVLCGCAEKSSAPSAEPQPIQASPATAKRLPDAEALGLSAEQEVKIKELRDAADAKMRAVAVKYSSQLLPYQKELAAADDGKKELPAATKKAVQAIEAKVKSETDPIRAQLRKDEDALLDPEQRAKRPAEDTGKR